MAPFEPWRADGVSEMLPTGLPMKLTELCRNGSDLTLLHELDESGGIRSPHCELVTPAGTLELLSLSDP